MPKGGSTHVPMCAHTCAHTRTHTHTPNQKPKTKNQKSIQGQEQELAYLENRKNHYLENRITQKV